MKVVFCASEAVPFSKTGGLADVAGALPLELASLGIEVVLIVPKYSSVRVSGTLLRPFDADFDTATLGANGRVYFLKHDMYLRSGLYGDSAGDYPDNLKRFAYFCQKALALLPKIKFIPDIVHGHDWQTSLLPLYLKDTKLGLGPACKLPQTLLTIHNMAYQGVFSKTQLPETGLGWDYFSVMGLEFYDKINLLKGGILFSDFVNTVSVTYAKEVLTPEHGCGLEGVLGSKRTKFVGIPNGIDYRTWNPQNDMSIFKRYGTGHLRDKRVNKVALQETCGLTRDDRAPLIGFVGRLVGQKGVDLILKEMSALFMRRPLKRRW
jgi:starch synthase